MILECPTQTLQETRGLVLETKRLTLRQPALADVKAIAAIVGDKRVSINLRRVPHPYTLDDATDFVTSSANSGETVFLVKNADEPIGLVGLSWETEGVPELGYCFGVDHWGKGYATEAAQSVIDFGFQEFSIERMTSGARVVNTASRHVLEKCGFNWTGVELNRFLALGSSTPVDCFRLERSVWSSIRNWSNSTRSA